MGKVYNDGITVGNGFEPTAAVPLDFRTVVKTHSDLDTVSSVYKGLSVFVEDEEKSYKYLGLDEDNNRIWEPDGGNIESIPIEDINALFTEMRITSSGTIRRTTNGKIIIHNL